MRISVVLSASLLFASIGTGLHAQAGAVPPPPPVRQSQIESPQPIMPRPFPRKPSSIPPIMYEKIVGNPSLKARINGVSSTSAFSNDLKISNIDMAVTVRGTIAETTMTVRFDNPSSATLEGDFTLSMPANSVVTGYALDIQGGMVDGVLVPPRQAQLAYSQRVTQRVDPGIAEVTRGAEFNTKIFPIFAGQSRTIRLKFVTPLDSVTGYNLPIVTKGTIGAFTLRITADGKYAVPVGLVGKETADGLVYSSGAFTTNSVLSIMPADKRANMIMSEHSGEGRFFEIADTAPVTLKNNKGGALSILWDRSRSRLDQKHVDEIALIKRYIAQKEPKNIDLILFDSASVERITLSSAEAVETKLNSVRYNGATSFAALASLNLAGTETCLLFSDGIATLDKSNSFAPPCRLFAVTSTREAEKGFLDNRARKTGGELIDLSQVSVDVALTRMTRNVPSVVDVRSESGQALDYAVLDGGVAGWRIVGQAPNTGAVLVKLAGIGPGVTERQYEASAMSVTPFNGPGALWASSRIGALSGEGDRKGALQLARRYVVASPVAAFIVLETPRDYAEAEIAPPASYPKVLRAQYDTLAQGVERNKAEAQKQRLTQVASIWDDTRDWWGKKHSPGSRQKQKQTADAAAGAAGEESAGEGSGEIVTTGSAPDQQPRVRPQTTDSRPEPMPAPPPSPVASAPAPAAPVAREAVAEADAVAGNMTQAKKAAASGPTITLQPWASDRPYIKAYGDSMTAFWTVFATQEKKHGNLPAFYLDTAEWLFANGMKADAIRMAESALELPSKNNVTLDILAARLLRYGAVDRAIGLLEQLVELEPDRPQPRRSLALALVKRASFQKSSDLAKADLLRALTLLSEIINQPWNDIYRGAELVALFDANAIIPRLRAIGVTNFPLDQRLITEMQSDIRIVVDWNTQATDMDLWVDEPNGERVIYSDQRSSSGGHLSDDMTAGYGPEQYFIRTAPPGEYVIRMNTYATDRLNPNGATNVTARITRNFGRSNQTEELIDLEIMPDKGGERLVGKVRI